MKNIYRFFRKIYYRYLAKLNHPVLLCKFISKNIQIMKKEPTKDTKSDYQIIFNHFNQDPYKNYLKKRVFFINEEKDTLNFKYLIKHLAFDWRGFRLANNFKKFKNQIKQDDLSIFFVGGRHSIRLGFEIKDYFNIYYLNELSLLTKKKYKKILPYLLIPNPTFKFYSEYSTKKPTALIFGDVHKFTIDKKYLPNLKEINKFKRILFFSEFFKPGKTTISKLRKIKKNPSLNMFGEYLEKLSKNNKEVLIFGIDYLQLG